MRETGLLSVVIPAYHEEAMIEKTAHTIGTMLAEHGIPYELLFVDDGSRDNTWALIRHLSQQNPAVRGLRFSRNFGKEAAILSGLTAARGACCVVIDCDLQHPPEKILEMYALWQQGYDIVEGRKISRGTERPWRTLAAKAFYRLISKATGCDLSHASDFKLLDRAVVEVLIHLRERHTFFRALSSWVGFRTTHVSFAVREREAGASKWSTASLIRYAVRNLASFSTAPLQLVTILGALMLLASLVLGGIALVQKLLGQALGGFTTVILIQLFSSSLVMISLGIIGYYLAKLYEEIKDRPRYLIAETCGEDRHASSHEKTP